MSKRLSILAVSIVAMSLGACASDPNVVQAHYAAEQARFQAYQATRVAVYQNQHPIVEFTAFEGKPIKIEAASLKVFAPIQSNGDTTQLAPVQQYVNPDTQAAVAIVNSVMPFIGGMGLLYAGKSLVDAATSPLQQTATSGFNALSLSNTSSVAGMQTLGQSGLTATTAVGQSGMQGMQTVSQSGMQGMQTLGQSGLAATSAVSQAGMQGIQQTATTGIITVKDTATAGLTTTKDVATTGINAVKDVSTTSINNLTGLGQTKILTPVQP